VGRNTPPLGCSGGLGGKSLLKWFAQLKTLPKLWVRTTDH